jgi:hypothetical protein
MKPTNGPKNRKSSGKLENTPGVAAAMKIVPMKVTMKSMTQAKKRIQNPANRYSVGR